MTTKTTPDLTALMTAGELSRLLSLSLAKTYAMAARGELPVVRIDRSVRFRRDRIAAWLDERSR
jgi:excisionase family DNA binding protein